MFGRVRRIEKEEEVSEPVSHANPSGLYRPVQQVRDFICSYIDRPLKTGEERAQQRMDRTGEILALAFANQPETGSGNICLLDQLIDIATRVVERHEREERSVLEAPKPAELPGWIAPCPTKPPVAARPEP